MLRGFCLLLMCNCFIEITLYEHCKNDKVNFLPAAKSKVINWGLVRMLLLFLLFLLQHHRQTLLGQKVGGSSQNWKCQQSCWSPSLLFCPGPWWVWSCSTLWSTRPSLVGLRRCIFSAFSLSGRYLIPLFSSADIQQIITDPVQAVNDAVDEVSSLLGKFQGNDKLADNF